MKRLYLIIIGFLTFCIGTSAQNYILIDGEERTVYSVEKNKVYGDDNSFGIRFYLSNDKEDFVAVMGNIELHAQSDIIDLSESEDKHAGQAYWCVRYYKNGILIFDSQGEPSESVVQFTKGSLQVSGWKFRDGKYGVGLYDGQVTDNKRGDKQTHTIRINYRTEWIPPTIGTLNIDAVTSSSIALTWDTASDNDTHLEDLRYIVLYKVKDADGWNSVKVGNATSYTIENLNPETTYKVMIQVLDAAGNYANYDIKEGTTDAASYSINVTNGKAYASIGKNKWKVVNKAPAGATIRLVASNPGTKYIFDKWVAESSDICFADATASTTTFTMPEAVANIKATFKDKPEDPEQTSFIYQGVRYDIDTDGNAYVADNRTTNGDIIIPATVYKGEKAYQVYSIGENAFASNAQLTSIDIQAYLKTIGRRAFSNCTSLSTVTMPDYLQELDEFAFEGCTALSSIKIPACIKHVRKETFKGCSALLSVTLPETVRTIGTEAFSGCEKLSSIILPNLLSEIGARAFEECYALESVTCHSFTPPTMINFNAFSDRTYSDALLCVPAETSYAYQQDYGWDNFTNLHNIEGVEAKLFTYNGIQYGVDSNGDAYVAYNETVGGVVTIPQTVYNNEKSYSVVQICDNAFAWNRDLNTINIQGKTEKIGNHAFFKCSELSSTTFSSDMTSISSEAFSGCAKLTSLTFPESLTDIGAKAFADCLSLESVTCLSLEPPTMEDYNAFSDYTYETATLTVPGDCYYVYIQSYGWDLFTHTVSSGIEQIAADNDTSVDIYNLQGILIKHNATSEDLRSLPAGIYITHGKKIIVK